MYSDGGVERLGYSSGKS